MPTAPFNYRDASINQLVEAILTSQQFYFRYTDKIRAFKYLGKAYVINIHTGILKYKCISSSSK